MVSARLQWFWPVFALVLGYIIYQLRDAMVPFAAAFFLAYLATARVMPRW